MAYSSEELDKAYEHLEICLAAACGKNDFITRLTSQSDIMKDLVEEIAYSLTLMMQKQLRGSRFNILEVESMSKLTDMNIQHLKEYLYDIKNYNRYLEES